jgi:gamma-glutamyltranspeptidase/glutathione hydrolase
MREAGLVASAAAYARPDGTPYQVGDVWKQPQLADTLERIALEGSDAFYRGSLAATMATEVTKAGGIWTVEDLESYRAIERKPLEFDYRDHHIITMPPPSAGGVVVRQILAGADALALHRYPWRSVDELHLYVELARRVYADRNVLLGDPDFIDMPLAALLDPQYVARRVSDVDILHATPSSAVQAGMEPGRRESVETTHFSVADGQGNAVANTYTLNLGFGCGFVVPGTGVLLNNEMDDFAVVPGQPNAFGLIEGEQNRIEPGKRMLSSMTPTIVLANGELRAIVGSPGGSTIATTVLQIVRVLIDYDLPLEDAVGSPRVHHQWLPDQVWAEDRLPAETEAGLRERGHTVRRRGTLGHANCIEVEPTTRGFRAVADVSRDGGSAVAY